MPSNSLKCGSTEEPGAPTVTVRALVNQEERMKIADAQKFLQENHRACIAVRQKDGWPQMTFVTPGIDPEGRVIITSRGTTYKIKHLRRDPRVSMLIFGEQYSGSKFVQIHGTGEIIEQPTAMDTLIYWYKQVRGEYKNWEDYKKQMADEKRVIIRVNIEKVGPQTVNRI
ncbi:MAG: TIGR03618 family F420-dependent PPOX class oxidoreductase [Deltaproteobacteria bacterium]|nr:MAG: TIGR03618 family F420-dependent PPOX class oxidoreductase [Deltaproteobacteria bacterium]